MPESNTDDINRTIDLWERTGVDYCDAWWAIGKRTPCWGGWGQVRLTMLWQAARWARADDAAARRAA